MRTPDAYRYVIRPLSSEFFAKQPQTARPNRPDTAHRPVERGGDLRVTRRRGRHQQTEQHLTARKQRAERAPELIGTLRAEHRLLGRLPSRLLNIENGVVVGENDPRA